LDIQKKIVTNVNLGYVPLLENLLYFLGKTGLADFLHVYAIGKNCKKKLDDMGIDSFLIEDASVGDEAIPWKKGNWKKLSYQKIRVIKHALDIHGSFLYTDPDVIFQKDVFPFLETLPAKYDIYGQNDYPNHRICSGFMYIRNNPNTQRVFSVGWEEYDKMTVIGDQIYINARTDLLRLYSLPQHLFINGIWFDDTKERFIPDAEFVNNAYIVHYNFAYSLESKYDKMKLNGHLRVNAR